MAKPDSFPRDARMVGMDRSWNVTMELEDLKSKMLLDLFKLCDELGFYTKFGPPIQTFSIPRQIVSTISSSVIESVIEGRIQ